MWICAHACVYVYVPVLVCFFERLCMLQGTRESRFKAHPHVEWQVESLWGTMMDGGATSDLRRRRDHSQSEGPLREIQSLHPALYLSLYTSHLPVFVLPNYLFNMEMCLYYEFTQRSHLLCEDQTSPLQMMCSYLPAFSISHESMGLINQWWCVEKKKVLS